MNENNESFAAALAETQREYREALDRLADSPAPVPSGGGDRGSVVLTAAERESLVAVFAASTRSPHHLAFLVEPVVGRIIAQRIAEARTEQAEQIAQAIESERDEPTFDHGHWMEGESRGFTLAAAIARTGSDHMCPNHPVVAREFCGCPNPYRLSGSEGDAR